VGIANEVLGTNMSQCDYLFRIDSHDNDTNAVDGPSAGGAMTLLAMSALSGKHLRPGLTMTGTIEPDGTIGAVGSVDAKARAAAEAGRTIFISPMLSIYERLLLSGVKKKSNITVLEAQDIFEAAAIAFSNGTMEEDNVTYEQTAVPANLTPGALAPASRFSHFKSIAEATISDGERNVAGALANGDGTFDNYFAGEMNASRALMAKGYYYSAANLAFLTQIDASVLSKKPTADEVYRTRAEVSACIDGAKRPQLREGNYEEVFGGDLRLIWARRRLAEMDKIDASSEDGAIVVLNGLEYSGSWCKLAERLYGAPATGKALDEGRLQALAEQRVAEASVAVAEAGEDPKWHAQAASEAYAVGNYGAALYDAAYATSTALADSEMQGDSTATIRARIERMNNQTVEGLWPQLYRGQSVYYASGRGANLVGAFRLAAFVQELEETNNQASGEMLKDSEVANGNGKGAGGNVQPAGNDDASLNLTPEDAALLTLLVMGAVFILGYEAAMLIKSRIR
jgi:hypothetical protein